MRTYYRQGGCLPTILFVGGILFTIYLFGIYFSLVAAAITMAVGSPDISTAIGFSEIFTILIVAIFGLFLPYFGVIIASTFPAVRVDETGLFVKTVFHINHFPWDEVRRVDDASNFLKGAKAIVLLPHGNALINFFRYYPYFLYGVMAGVSFEPVVLLSNGLSQRDEMIKTIGDHLRAKIKAQTSLPLRD